MNWTIEFRKLMSISILSSTTYIWSRLVKKFVKNFVKKRNSRKQKKTPKKHSKKTSQSHPKTLATMINLGP